MKLPLNGIENNVWDVIFDHTPPVIRWMLGVLTLGIFTLAGIVYHWRREELQNEREQHKRDIDALHARIGRFENRVNEMDRKLDHHLSKTNELLVQISQNTGRHNADS